MRSKYTIKYMYQDFLSNHIRLRLVNGIKSIVQRDGSFADVGGTSCWRKDYLQYGIFKET